MAEEWRAKCIDVRTASPCGLKVRSKVQREIYPVAFNLNVFGMQHALRVDSRCELLFELVKERCGIAFCRFNFDGAYFCFRRLLG